MRIEGTTQPGTISMESPTLSVASDNLINNPMNDKEHR